MVQAEGLAEFVYSGLLKVASVAKGADYDNILGDKINSKQYLDLLRSDNNISISDSYSLIKDILFSKSFERFDVAVDRLESDEVLLCFGTTLNNRKEFDFLSSKLKSFGYNRSLVNICDFPRVKDVKANESTSRLLLEVFSKFCQNKGGLYRGELHQYLNYLLFCLGALNTINKLCKHKRLCVANDHSPMQVAYTKIAEYYGFKTCYIQHAEVTSIFPPLDYDLSILRNLKSKEEYRRSPECGLVVYASRSNHEVSCEVLLNALRRVSDSEEVDVVIYLTGIYDLEELQFLVERLLQNAGVNTVGIKPHPSAANLDVFNFDGAVLIGSHLDSPHVAICGSSSVALELLSSGVLVFNAFFLDNIKKDYYGFVKDGLTIELTKNDLEGCFWKVDCESALDLDNFGRYMSFFRSKANILEDLKLPCYLSRFLGESSASSIFDNRLRTSLSLYPRTYFNTLRQHGTALVDGYQLIKGLEALFNKRDPMLNNLYMITERDKCKSALDFWLNTKVIEWNGLEMTKCQEKALISFVMAYPISERKLVGWMELKMFDILLRCSTPVNVISFLHRARLLKVSKLGINKRVAYVRYIMSNSGFFKELSGFYNFRKSDLTPFELLKIRVQCEIRNKSGRLLYRAHKYAQENFMKYQQKLSREYSSKVASFYNSLGSHRDLVDVSRNAKVKDRFLSLIIKSLQTKTGFSFIRLSDGEGFIFSDEHSEFTHRDSLNRQRHWWGEEIPNSISVKLKEELREAVGRADILGLPTVYRFLRDHTDASTSLGASLQGRGLLTVLNAVSKSLNQDFFVTDDKANVAVLSRMENLLVLTNYASRVIVVNSGSEEDTKKAFEEYFKFIHVQVPTHFKTKDNPKYASAEKTLPLPYVYNDIRDKLLSLCGPGDIVLVGAGVAGKVFIDAAKRNGAVGLDLGSAMDQYVGGNIHSLF